MIGQVGLDVGYIVTVCLQYFTLTARTSCVVVVVVCLLRPMEGNGVDSNIQILTELPVSPQSAGVVGTFLKCALYIYI